MSDHSIQVLQNHILSRSESSIWQIALTEWIPSGVSYYWNTCPCGVAIKENIFLYNTHTQQETHVGNVCIEHFSHIHVDDSVFDGIKRIQDDIRANTNVALTKHCHQHEILNEKEAEFLFNTALSRKLSEKQLAWKEKLNTRILKELTINH